MSAKEIIITNFKNFNPITNVYGLVRSLLALGTLLTLLTNDLDIIFITFDGLNNYPSGLKSISLFSLIGTGYHSYVILSINLVLILVISGYRPRYTGILHWYVTFSYFISSNIVDGGDQIASILTFLLIPFTLFDNRTWHWNRYRSNESFNVHKKMVLYCSWHLIRLQMSILYLNAAVSKLSVEEWINGTAMYYWLTHNIYGVSYYLHSATELILSNSILVSLATWFVLVLEFTLSGVLFSREAFWKYFLYVGLLFHIAIAFFMGLITFGLSMSGGLILYLKNPSREFDLNKLIDFLLNRWNFSFK